MPCDSLISVEEAEAVVLGHAVARPTANVPLADAVGAVLREEVYADRDVPPYDRVTMDGIACSMSEWANGRRDFAILGEQPAGSERGTLDTPQGCLRITTGAVLPRGADLVIPREYIEERDGRVYVANDAPAEKMRFVHARGSDADEGKVVLRAGCRIGPAETLIAAAVGRTALSVTIPPACAVVSNGDELVPAESTPLPHQVRISNALALEAGLRSAGVRETASRHFPDDRDAMRAGMGELLDQFDVLILSGGVSVGPYDFMPLVLEDLGVRRLLHRVRQRPGRPFWFGVAPQGQVVFALPGNPVSTLVCYLRYVRPWLDKGLGLSPSSPRVATLAEEVNFEPALTYFLQVTEAEPVDGRPMVHPAPHHGSGDYVSLSGTSGFIELPAEGVFFPVGYTARFFPWG